jgi:hypothetical protein
MAKKRSSQRRDSVRGRSATMYAKRDAQGRRFARWTNRGALSAPIVVEKRSGA